MVDITFCGWNITTDQRKIIEKITEKTKELLDKEISINVIDVQIVEPWSETDFCIAFGDIAYNSIPDNFEIWKVPEISLLIGANSARYKQQTIETLKEIKGSLDKEEEKSKKEVYVETDKKVTIGTNADIEITQQEAEYLRNIKEIVGGGTIVIKKDDIEIRIEDKDDGNTGRDPNNDKRL